MAALYPIPTYPAVSEESVPLHTRAPFIQKFRRDPLTSTFRTFQPQARMALVEVQFCKALETPFTRFQMEYLPALVY